MKIVYSAVVVVPPLKIMMICPKPQKDFRDPIIKTTFVAEENCGCQMGIMFNVKILKMILNLSRLLRLTQLFDFVNFALNSLYLILS